MSTMFFLLVFLLFLGVTNAYVLYAKDPFLDGASDGSDLFAKSFIKVLRNAIEHKDAGKLNKIISNDVLFIDCSKTYDKQELIRKLSQFHYGTKWNIEYQSSHYYKKKKISIDVNASWLGVNTRVYFAIDATKGRFQLVLGKVKWCPRG